MQHVLLKACFFVYTSTLQITGNQAHHIALAADSVVVVSTTQSCVPVSSSSYTFPVQSVDTADTGEGYFPLLHIIYLFKRHYFLSIEIFNPLYNYRRNRFLH